MLIFDILFYLIGDSILDGSENILNEDTSIYFSSVQRGIIKAMLKSTKPLTLNEVFHSFSKRPCAKKLIPQIVSLKTKGLIVCKPKGNNCMDFEFQLTDKGRKLVTSK